MRKENSIRNVIVAVTLSIITTLIGLIAQKIFIQLLGEIYLGLNGLFNNIISMLSIADLGIGAAIVYNLYKPIAEENKERIATLMNFYKKSYRIIAIVILILGLCIMPFLNNIVDGEDIQAIKVNIYIVFGLFLIDTIASYLLTYKRSMLYANQKNYIINLVHIGYIVILNILQIII
ncbi:MAG: polysaccharide transporter, partial [Clostridia bacterium]|nr:polysaccharide transporter [Clostridia bacterium]